MFTIYNYADDNTVAFINKNFIFKLVLKAESFNLISWFGDNFIKTNPDKFQSIYVGKKTNDNINMAGICNKTSKQLANKKKTRQIFSQTR